VSATSFAKIYKVALEASCLQKLITDRQTDRQTKVSNNQPHDWRLIITTITVQRSGKHSYCLQ